MTFTEVLNWLLETDPSRLETLWAEADRVRREYVGEAVHLRGLVEISNHCVRLCAYCGLRAANHLPRYRMTAEEILACAHQALSYGYGTVVMQSGEDYGITREWMADVIRRLQADTPLAVTLSLGERPDEDLAAWREAGADRYLLRFETSDRELYERLHPPRPGQERSDRIAILHRLRELGYETGSGVMIGIPGQSYESLARDLCLFAELDLDMVGVGPWIAHPDTPLGQEMPLDLPQRGSEAVPVVSGHLPYPGEVAASAPPVGSSQVPPTEEMTYKVLALTRLLCPQANIPSTTALAALNQETGRELGLARGANVIMPNLTPPQCRVLYEIYPDKACLSETAEVCVSSLPERLRALGRVPGQGPGGRQR
ncbi:MAG: [FeFe] hydrogenase H-cluster radical SAM maturase HydE [candidate division WS1 bacterium]|nr:[FeFe] hydrogenase H-cluster radical SAM maturase HydE [candidate division WS1 bacterium]